MSAPAELLLLSAASGGSAEGARLIESGSVDWGRLMGGAERHRLIPLFSRMMLSVPFRTPLLNHLTAELARRAENIAHQNVILSDELLRLLEVFERERIPVIPYKGPVLAQYLYRDISFRQFVDLDLLVPENAVGAASAALVREGYVRRLRIPARHEADYVRYRCDHEFYHPVRNIGLDLHWKIVPDYFSAELDYGGIWKRAGRFDFNGKSVNVFSDEDLLMILCVHGGKHVWERIGWLADVHRLIQTRSIDWERAMEASRRAGIERLVLLALALCRDHLGTALPEEISQKIRKDRAVGALQRHVLKTFFGGEDAPPGLVEKGWFHLACRERPWDRIRYLLQFVFVPTHEDWNFFDPPSVLGFLRYPARFVRLFSKYIAASR